MRETSMKIQNSKKSQDGQLKVGCYLAPFILGISLMALSFHALAGNFQSLESLRVTARAFLEQQTALQHGQDAEISIARLDNRLQLTECSKTPSAFLSPGAKLQGKLTVGLRCTGQKPWTVYIPAHIKNFAEIAVAARPLSRGIEISNSDVITIRQDLSLVRAGYFKKTNDIVGKILKRSMPQGLAFSPNFVTPALLVRRGDEVTILASVGGLQVRGKGKALKDAALGESVPVRNKQSKRIVQGIAVKSGIVSVQM